MEELRAQDAQLRSTQAELDRAREELRQHKEVPPPDTYCEYSICRLLTACETVYQPQFWCQNCVSDAGICGFSLVVAWAPAFPVLPVFVGTWAVFWFCWHCDYGRYNSDTCSSRSTLAAPFSGVQMFKMSVSMRPDIRNTQVDDTSGMAYRFGRYAWLS